MAVAVLLLAAASGAYLAERELDKAEDAKRERLLALMESVAEDVRVELSLVGASEAYGTVSGWDEHPVNETRISEAYSSRVKCYLDRAFPRERSGVSISVSNWSGGLFLLEKQTWDITQPEGGVDSSLELEGVRMEYEDLPPPTTDELAVTTANPYYVALGHFSVVAGQGSLVLSKNLSFDRPIISALPYLESKLRAFQASSEGELSDMGRLLGYMLSTLAQLRVLEGHGVPTYTGLDTSSILTETDVHRAVAVSLLIEQARLFRDIDEAFAAEVVEACGGSPLGLLSLESSRGRCLDPAELFLWFLGKTEPSLDPVLLAAQAVAGMADQLVLKTMEYMGWLGVIGAVDEVLGFLSGSVESAIELLTGEDQSLSAVVSWVRRTVELTTIVPELHTSAFRSDTDLLVSVPERTYFVENAAGELFPVWVGGCPVYVDVPTHDLLSVDEWSEFYPEFKELQASLTGLLYDGLKRLAFDIASTCAIELSNLAFDPADGEGLFEGVLERVGDLEVSFSPEELLSAGARLPFFSAQYALAQAFSDFISSHSQTLIPDAVAHAMYDALSAEVIDTANHSAIPDLVVPVEQQLEEVIRCDVESDPEWGVGEAARTLFDSRCESSLGTLGSCVMSSVDELDDGFAGPLVDAVAATMVAGAGAFPGLKDVVEDSLGAFAKAALGQAGMSSFKQVAYLDLGGTFTFWDGSVDVNGSDASATNTTLSVEVLDGLPPMTMVPYDPGLGLDSLERLFPADELLVQVKRPWDHDRSREDYPNTHLTSVTNISATPYSSQWVVQAKGLLALRTSSTDQYISSVLGEEPVSESVVRISVCVPVVVQSAWPLEGVGYNPTDTILTDALDLAAEFKDRLWDMLEPALGWVKDGLESIYHFVQDVFRTMASFTVKVVKVVARCVQVMVETLQAYVEALADSALARAVDLFLDIVGNVEFRMSVYGFTVIVQTNVPDLLFKKSQDLVRIILCTDRLGPGLAFGFRIAKLSDGRMDVVVNGTVKLRSGTVEVVLDPLMVVLRRLAEVHCRAGTWALDMTMPEAEPYETAEVSTADIPGLGGLLSNIPIPLLGLRASVEAGLRLKYSPPFPSDVVINEFEANPQGEDSGREWVELYNPLDEPRCVDGWSVLTAHGESHELPITGTIPANGLIVFTFPQTSVDNGYPDDPFNDGDSLVLVDSSGRTVDSTPTMRDSANDGRTHQRTWDGGPRWSLSDGTKGMSNGPSVALATSDFIAKALFSAFKQAFEETAVDEVSPSLGFVTLLAKRVLHHFIENLLSIVKEVIHEVILYFEVSFGDAVGVSSVGIRTSFVVTGEAIVDVLRWLIHSVATFVVNLGRAGNPIAYPAAPAGFFSNLYVRFEVFSEIGTPRLVAALGVTEELQDRLTCVACIAPNIPSLGRLVGRDWGPWKVFFGVYFERVPRELVSGFLLKDTGDEVDLWLVKGCAYGL